MKLIKIKDKNVLELLKGSSSSLVIKVLGMLFSYATMLFVTNIYGAEEWGIYSLCITTLSLVMLLPKFGFDNSLVRIIAELNTYRNDNEIVNVIIRAIIISTLISGIVILALHLFSDVIIYNILKEESMEQYIDIISLAVLPMALLIIIYATFQALKKTTLFMLFKTTLINLIFLILLLIYYLNGAELKIFKIYFYSIVIVLLISLVVLLKQLKLNEVIKPIKEKTFGFKKIIKISSPMFLSSSFSLLMSASDIMMLSYFNTSFEIGIYNSSLKLAALSVIPLIAVNSIATPKFVEFYSKKDSNGLKNTVQKSTQMIFYMSAPIIIILILFPKSILGFFGEEFIIGYMALIYLCISRFINAISGSVGFIMQMTDQQTTYQNIIIIAFIINLILNYLLIPIYSFNGAAIASSVATVFWNVALIIIIKKRLGFWTFYIPKFSK